jgi:hypothetical protein
MTMTGPSFSLGRILQTFARAIGKKEDEKVSGEKARSRGAQAHRKMKKRDHDSWWWMKVLAGIRTHDEGSRGPTSRRGTLRWKMSWFAFFAGALHGSR